MKENFEFLPIYRDLMFKNLFGTEKNKKFTIDMLEKLFCLEKGSLNGSIIKNSVNLDKETVLNKKFELDIIVETPNKDILNLEMQCIYNKDAKIKNFMYVTGLFYSQLKTSENYKETKKVTGINFIKSINTLEENKNIQTYVMTNVDNPNDKMLPELFNVIVINVDHNCEIFYNKTKNDFEGWRLFIGADTIEELEKISKTDPVLKEAYKESIRFMNNEYAQDYSLQEKLIRSQMANIGDEYFIKGQEHTAKEIALNLLTNTNISLEEISKCTNIPVNELKELQSKISKNKREEIN